MGKLQTKRSNPVIEPIEIKLPSGLNLVLWPRPGKWSWLRMRYDVMPETPEELWDRMDRILSSLDFAAVVHLYSQRAGRGGGTVSKFPAAEREQKKKTIATVLQNLKAQTEKAVEKAAQ